MTFEANIKAWLEFAAPDATVKQAPYKGHRPDSPYITYQIINVDEMQDGYRADYSAGKDTRYTSAVLMVSVNVYADKGYAYLSHAKALGDVWEARELLKAGGLALSYMDGGATVNLTALGDTEFRSRYQSDLLFHADMTHERTRSLISQWHLGGKFVADDGLEVPSSVDWP